MVFCCFGCVSKKVSGYWFLALLEAAAAMKIGDQIGQNWISSRIPSEEPVRKLGDVLLFRLCFEKGVWLLVSCFIRGSSSSQNWRSKLDKIWILVRFQKGRFGLRGTCYCDWFCVIFDTKLGGVLLFRLCFEKGVWLLVSSFSFDVSASGEPVIATDFASFSARN